MANQFFGAKDYRKIQVIPEFRPEQEKECIMLVMEKGINQVLEFWDILSFVIGRIEPNKNYRDSEFFQAMKLFKGQG